MARRSDIKKCLGIFDCGGCVVFVLMNFARIFSTYNCVHFGSVLTYLLVRLTFDRDEAFASKENNAMMLCVVWTTVRLKRNLTVEGRLTQIFNLCKLTVLYLTYLQDIRISAVYGVIFLALYFIPLSDYRPRKQKVTPLSPLAFTELVENPSGESSKQQWLVVMYANWAYHCRNVMITFAELSDQYVSDTLKFGKVDVGLYTKIAERHGISTSANTSQLPTFILFEGGKEVCRLPEIDSSGRVKRPEFSKEVIKKYFALGEEAKKPTEKTTASDHLSNKKKRKNR